MSTSLSTQTPHPSPRSPRRAAWRGRLLSWLVTLGLCVAVLVVGGRLRAPDVEGEAPEFTLTSLDGVAKLVEMMRESVNMKREMEAVELYK